MDNIFAGIVIGCVVVFALIGFGFSVGDFRYFNTIAHQCEKQGYIQDKTTRVLCSIEKRDGV